MNNGSYIKGAPQICLHCMSAYVVDGVCRNCGKPPTDENRSPNALPFGYRLQTPRNRLYLIGRVLGEGGFGITYLAWDQAGRRPVALKELFPNRFSRAANMELNVEPNQLSLFLHFKKRFLDEAHIISSLRNEPRIVNIYDYFELNGTGYYTMEYLRGTDMQHWIMRKQAPLTWKELESPILQVLKGLSVLHGYGLIHRDISPDNIFVCADRQVKLIDFGSVRSANADHFTTILKQHYAPPEQLLADGNQGFWTDTYSLCATIYYLLSGRLPAQSYNRVAAVKTGGTDPLVPLSQLNTAAPDYVLRAVMHGMNIDESSRFQNVEEMRSALFPGTQREKSRPGSVIECVNGVYKGRHFVVAAGSYASLGRGEGSNAIPFPANTPAVSRRHCVLYTHPSGKLYVQDQESRYGTFVDRRRIPPGRWIPLNPGQTFSIGNEQFVFKTPTMNGGKT